MPNGSGSDRPAVVEDDIGGWLCRRPSRKVPRAALPLRPYFYCLRNMPFRTLGGIRGAGCASHHRPLHPSGVAKAVLVRPNVNRHCTMYAARSASRVRPRADHRIAGRVTPSEAYTCIPLKHSRYRSTLQRRGDRGRGSGNGVLCCVVLCCVVLCCVVLCCVVLSGWVHLSIPQPQTPLKSNRIG